VDTPLRVAIATIEGAITDAREGLPEDVFAFVSRVTPLVNVDLLIKDDRSRTLLTWRDDEFFGAGWHLPGGIIRYKESAAERILACAREELGAGISSDREPLLVVESIGSRETRGHHISLLYRCHLTGNPDTAREARSDRPASGEWRWHDQCPPDLLEAQRVYARFL